MIKYHYNGYLFSICIVILFLVIFSLDNNKIFAQTGLNNNTGITDENEIQDVTEEQSTLERYNDSLKRFSLTYPENWYAYEDSPGTLSIESPKENETDLYVDIFLVSSSNMSQLNYLQNESISFDEIVQSELDNLKLVNDFQLIESATINLNKINNSNPAHKFVYTYSDPSIGNAKALDIVIKKDDQLYYLTYITKPSDYFKSLPSIQKILDSFEFTNGIINDENIDGPTLNDSWDNMNDFIGSNLDKYQQQFNEDNNILSDFGESLSNSIFNDTSIFALLSYSLVDNVKVVGAQVIDNNSINVTLGYNNKTDSLTPSVTVVAYKLDIDISDLFSFLASAVAGGEEMMMPSSNLFEFNNNMPIFDIISNFKVGSNIAEAGWSSPHGISIKVKNGETLQNESDTSLLLIELIPME